MIEINPLKITKTRFAELGLSKIGKDWRYMDLTDGAPAAIGPYFSTKIEALAELGNYAEQFGCNA
jgi:hypothetical protein